MGAKEARKGCMHAGEWVHAAMPRAPDRRERVRGGIMLQITQKNEPTKAGDVDSMLHHAQYSSMSPCRHTGRPLLEISSSRA